MLPIYLFPDSVVVDTVNLGGILSIFTVASFFNSVPVIQNLYVPVNDAFLLTLTSIVAFPSVNFISPFSVELMLYFNFPFVPKLAIISNLTFWLVQSPVNEVLLLSQAPEYVFPFSNFGIIANVSSALTTTVCSSDSAPTLPRLSTTLNYTLCSPTSLYVFSYDVPFESQYTHFPSFSDIWKSLKFVSFPSASASAIILPKYSIPFETL